MNFRLAHTGVAAGAVIMALGLLIAGGDPNDDEATLIVLAGLFTVGAVMGALAERRDQARRRDEAESSDDRL